METNHNRTLSQDTCPPLQVRKSLIPIDEYAVREGVSKSTIEQCGKLGMLRIRKHKGKTFVVDVPMAASAKIAETSTLGTNALSESIEDPFEVAPEDGYQKSAETIELTPSQTADTTDDRSPRHSETLGRDQWASDLETLEILDDPLGAIDELAEIEDMIDPSEGVPKISEPSPKPWSLTGFLEILRPKAAAKQPWRIAALFSILCVFALLSAYLWLYVDYRINLDKLSAANGNIEGMYDKSVKASLLVQDLRDQLHTSTIQMDRIQNELNNAKTQVKALRNQLARTTQALESMQQRDATTIIQLNKRIQQLTEQLTGTPKKR